MRRAFVPRRGVLLAHGERGAYVASDAHDMLRHVGAAAWPVAQIFLEDCLLTVRGDNPRPDRDPRHEWLR
jgi:hypothetical protein